MPLNILQANFLYTDNQKKISRNTGFFSAKPADINKIRQVIAGKVGFPDFLM